jgi:bifunctional non-homologous end joining protein LigD
VSPLDEYRAKRDFEATPEPSGDRAPGDDAERRRFVIQEHDATRLHWDLRLEHEGVLLSWALPRGVPWGPDTNHLAVHTEDHPIEYLDFHGEIPDGSYGAGRMTIWDEGTYELLELTDRKAVIVLHGQRAEGQYALFQTRGRDWMIHRMDPPADPTRRPVPDDLAPMLASPGRLPRSDDGWAFEVRWHGLRTLLTSSGGVVDLRDAEGADVSPKLPEVRRIGRALGMTEVVLDGVVIDPAGDGSWVERRLKLTSDSAVRRHANDHPLAFVAFDLLWLDGHEAMPLAWEQRRSLLEQLHVDGPAWRTPSTHRGDGDALLDAARSQGLAGLVAKKVDSPYRPGTTTKDWRLVPARKREPALLPTA